MNIDLHKSAEDLLLKVKMKEDNSSLVSDLASTSKKALKEALNTDDKKKAFWINIYNAYYQILRMEKKMSKPDIYKKKSFQIASTLLSLDNVEHGILRKNKYKYSLGFFNSLFPDKFTKENQVEHLDYRIHFALNCGAKSCPPIAFYNFEKIDQQLDWATQSFLEQESQIDAANKTITTTTLFKWFYADFGGRKGIDQIFKEQLDVDISNYKINYSTYSWEEDLANFTSS